MWDYSPRQTAAFLAIAGKRRQRELLELMAVQAMASRGDVKVLQKELRRLDE